MTGSKTQRREEKINTRSALSKEGPGLRRQKRTEVRRGHVREHVLKLLPTSTENSAHDTSRKDEVEADVEGGTLRELREEADNADEPAASLLPRDRCVLSENPRDVETREGGEICLRCSG